MTVDLVTIHHEAGASDAPGVPTDNVDRYSEGGYCCGIGNTIWKRWRSAADNWATYQFNGQDWTPCFSSDRHTQCDVTDAHIALLHDAFMDAYNRGEVTASPQVRAHRDSPGSATACPGDRTMAVWDKIVNACRADGSAPPSTSPPAGPGAAPPYPGVPLADFTEGNGTATWQARMAERGWTIDVDDLYGPASARVATQFQQEKGLAVDGVVGPETWNAAWTAPVT